MFELAIRGVQMALKTADVAYLASLAHVHKAWAERWEAECFLQGDRERSSGMAISPLMDRELDGQGMCSLQVWLAALPFGIASWKFSIFPVADVSSS